MITVALVSPCATTSSTQGSETKCAVSAAGSVAVAITSRSRNVSRRRRALPASETSTAAGCARSASTTSRTTGSPMPSRPRRGSSAPWPFRERLQDLRLGPRAHPRERAQALAPPPPPSARRASSLRARARSGPRSSGPSPGSRMNEATSPGTSARRFASASMSPVSTTSTILASIVLPMSGSSFALPVERQLGHRRRGVPDPGGGPAVGADAKRLLAEDLGEVGEQVEAIGQIAVTRERRGHPRS